MFVEHIVAVFIRIHHSFLEGPLLETIVNPRCLTISMMILEAISIAK